MTCNVVAPTEGKRPIGFRPGEEEAPPDPSRVTSTQLLQHFRQEFLARVDRIIAFRSLTAGDYQTLLDRHIATLADDIKHERSIGLEISDGARQHLCQLCADHQEGARGFIRLFERTLVAPRLEHIKTSLKQGVIRVDWAEGRPAVS